MIGLQPSTRLPNENSNLLSSIQNFISRTYNVFLLHHQFDGRKKQCCVMHSDSSWIVWDFEYQPPYFENDEFNLASIFPIFANVYRLVLARNLCLNYYLYKPIGAAPRWPPFFGGEGGLLAKKGVTLRGLRISEKKEILRKLTVVSVLIDSKLCTMQYCNITILLQYCTIL